MQLGLTALCIGLLGCDPGETSPPPERTEAAPSKAADSGESPILALAPWFELPADWAEQHPTLSPNAKTEAHFIGLAEEAAPKHPADGGGRAWLENVSALEAKASPATPRTNGPEQVGPAIEVSSFNRFEIVFEVGPLGIEQGGMIFLAPEPFWYWSEAQTADPRAPGYTTATPRREDVELRPKLPDAAFEVVGRSLAAGERIDFVYGAGDQGARVDRYAERGAEVLIGVDADGDGFREWVDDGVRVDVEAGPGVRLLAFGPAEIAPGEPFEILASITDLAGNRARWPDATRAPSGETVAAFALRVLDSSSLGLANRADRLEASGAPGAPRRLALAPSPGEGTLRLRIEGLDALEGMSFDLPPIVVREADERLVWGDLHGHTRVSDGTGTPHDYFAYARDVARLDLVALTDHDHWGPRALDQHPDVAARLLETAHSFHDPGRFVTIPGYEWTSWLHGHRHVLYFDEQAPIFSSLDPRTDRPDELWAALRGRPALTFAHHSAGEPVAVDWSFAPDPELEPLTEIVSVHGTSEAADAPFPVRGGIPGYYVRDTLVQGYRLGFIGSGDSHDGHPGLAQIASGQSGLAGIFTLKLDRASLLDAMRARRTFATNGIRPWLEVDIDGTSMGGKLAASGGDDAPEQTLHIRYEATAPIARIDLIRSGRVARIEGDGALSLRMDRKIPRLSPGEFHYVRIEQEDGGLAWSSPIFSN